MSTCERRCVLAASPGSACVHFGKLMLINLIFSGGPYDGTYSFSANRKDFSHCEANVKSPLDGVLRRGSVSVKPEMARWLVGDGADVLVMRA